MASGLGYCIHAAMVIVADGTDDAEQRLRRVLRNDPGMGVVRHAEAGYDVAKRTAGEHGLSWRNGLENPNKNDKIGIGDRSGDYFITICITTVIAGCFQFAASPRKLLTCTSRNSILHYSVYYWQTAMIRTIDGFNTHT